MADDINFFGKRNGARAQKTRRKLFSGDPGLPQETQETDVYGLNDQTEATLKQALA